MKNLLHKIFGTRNDRLLKHYFKLVKQINELEATIQQLDDTQLKAKTSEFQQRLQAGAKLAELLPEAFAVCREASVRSLGMRHFDVQLVGGMVLNDGKIAEMRTGEGKTLVATLAVYLNALANKGVHVVTVNDYLAQRDAHEMSKLYNFLGLTVGINLPDMTHSEKKQAYACDITYGTNNEFGFDYLRDNMVFNALDKVQRGLNFAVVDEVDSILIDEARTPLIISGAAEGAESLYLNLNKVPPLLTKQQEEKSLDGDFWVDEKNHNVILSEAGHVKVEQILLDMGLLKDGDSLYHAHNISLMHHLLAALKAHYVYLKDQHYVVQNGEVVIVDEFTGRLMSGRRWSDGLHQAVEAKEGVEIQRENQTLASITFQNYFRMYGKLSGMTGTADTEAYEFQQIYSLETVVIPTNKPMVRKDYNDKIYMSLADKYAAIVAAIKSCHEQQQPVLVGTTSVENSEIISQLLKKANLKHEVLNAKQHAREADIIVQAGYPGSITVATNMAGRGTDIILGGNPKPQIQHVLANDKLTTAEKDAKIAEINSAWQEANRRVLAAGGLAIIGTERHESRRIDNQLRGRSGRQGDAGTSCFYLSLDDPLLRIFGGERMRSMMEKFGMKPGESIEHKWLSRSIESAQRKVEGHNFDIRKQLLEYDNVFNEQRKVIYQQRDELLASTNLTDIVVAMITGVVTNIFDSYIPAEAPQEMWQINELDKYLHDSYLLDYNLANKFANGENPDSIKHELVATVLELYNKKMTTFAEKINHQVATWFIDNVINNADNLNEDAVEDFCRQNALEIDKERLKQLYQARTSLQHDELFKQVEQFIAHAGLAQVARFERNILLQYIDYNWREHLTQLEQLRQGIHLRGYAQKDPKREFQNEAFQLFALMLDNIKQDAVKGLITIKIQGLDDIPHEDSNNIAENASYVHESGSNVMTASTTQQASGTVNLVKQPVPTRQSTTIGRNSPCTCGSGKKYKHCHGKIS